MLPIIAKKHGVTNRDFLRCLKLDGMISAALDKPVLDIIATDNKFSVNDPEYDAKNCTYKGSECSMGDYIKQKFGEQEYNMLKELI